MGLESHCCNIFWLKNKIGLHTMCCHHCFRSYLKFVAFPWTPDLVKSWEIMLWAELLWYHAKFLPPTLSSYDSQPAGSCPGRQWAHELALNLLAISRWVREIAGEHQFMPTLIILLRCRDGWWVEEREIVRSVIIISGGEAEKISMLRMAMSDWWPCASWPRTFQCSQFGLKYLSFVFHKGLAVFYLCWRHFQHS